MALHCITAPRRALWRTVQGMSASLGQVHSTRWRWVAAIWCAVGLIDASQALVSGRVRLKIYKGGVHVIGRDSQNSLYDQDLVTFEEGAVAYDHHDAARFIKLNALRLRTLAKRRLRAGASAKSSA